MKIKYLISRVKKVGASLVGEVALWFSIWVVVVTIIWIIAIFVVSPNIANAITATATLTLAIAAFWAIYQNYNFRRKEKEEKLLNEIIEWAEAVANSAISRQTRKPPELWKTKLEYKQHKTKGKLIGEIVSSSFKELWVSFKDVNSKLDKAIEFTEQIEKGTGNVESLKDYEKGIAGSVEKLYKKAARIKTGDIS